MQPLNVQVITYAPTVFRHCQHCEVAFEGLGLGERMHRGEARDALPDDLAAEFQELSDWVHGLLKRHPGQLAISVIDAASIEGVWRSLRAGVRRYPAVIVNGEKRVGADFRALDLLVDERVSERAVERQGRRGEPSE
jgi:hypothetical protein